MTMTIAMEREQIASERAMEEAEATVMDECGGNELIALQTVLETLIPKGFERDCIADVIADQLRDACYDQMDEAKGVFSDELYLNLPSRLPWPRVMQLLAEARARGERASQ